MTIPETVSGRQIRTLLETDIATLQTIDEQGHGQAWSQRVFLDDLEQSNRLHLHIAHSQVESERNAGAAA